MKQLLHPGARRIFFIWGGGVSIAESSDFSVDARYKKDVVNYLVFFNVDEIFGTHCVGQHFAGETSLWVLLS